MNDERVGMKTKTIKTILRKRVNNWIKTIDDSELQSQCQKDIIITGGCIASMLLGEKINDFDVYFKTPDTTFKVAKYYVEKFKKLNSLQDDITVEWIKDIYNKDRIRINIPSEGVAKEQKSESPDESQDYNSEIYDDENYIKSIMPEENTITEQCEKKDEKQYYRPVFLSSNAITLSNKMQLILRFYGDPEEIHENYDFIHCTNYWDCNTGNLVLKNEALKSLLSKSLVYQGSRYPVCSVFRLRKFIKNGWRINAGQILKILLQVSNLDLSKYEILEDQLTGVDVAYFSQVISTCKQKCENDSEKIDQNYLIEIINRMFGD